VVQPIVGRTDIVKRHDPDLVIENFSAQTLSATGDIEYAVNAAKMLHFQDDDSSLLENVVFIVTRVQQPKITAKAPRGRLLKRADGTDEVIMDGGVRVESDPNEQFPPLMLITPKLTILPDKNLASSTDGVTLESPTGELTAKSFSLNTLTRHIVFENIEMNYVPRKLP
jgi:lipopolysaccharide export system protein LptC